MNSNHHPRSKHINAWLDMCQHPEKYCDACGKLKTFCRCQTQKQYTPEQEANQKAAAQVVLDRIFEVTGKEE